MKAPTGAHPFHSRHFSAANLHFGRVNFEITHLAQQQWLYHLCTVHPKIQTSQVSSEIPGLCIIQITHVDIWQLLSISEVCLFDPAARKHGSSRHISTRNFEGGEFVWEAEIKSSQCISVNVFLWRLTYNIVQRIFDSSWPSVAHIINLK